MLESTAKRAARALLGAALLGLAQLASAQVYPARPIRLLVPMPAGGTSDFWARLVAAKMSESLGQQVIVENRPGGATIIAAEAVSRAPADGYTMLLGDSATYAVNPTLFARLPYDPAKDLAPVTLTSRHVLSIAVNASSTAQTLAELVAHGAAERLTSHATYQRQPPCRTR